MSTTNANPPGTLITCRCCGHEYWSRTEVDNGYYCPDLDSERCASCQVRGVTEPAETDPVNRRYGSAVRPIG